MVRNSLSGRNPAQAVFGKSFLSNRWPREEKEQRGLTSDYKRFPLPLTQGRKSHLSLSIGYLPVHYQLTQEKEREGKD